MTFLENLLPQVEGKLDAEARKQRYLHDPVLWAKDFLGIQLWSKQREILYSVRDNRKVAVAAGHGVGKSYVAAVLMAWWIDVHPIGADDSGAPLTFVASTAPFADQISAILWNNVRILHALAKARHQEWRRRVESGQDVGDYAACDHELVGYITGDNKWKTDDGLLIGQGRKPPDNKTDSGYQGLHATYLLAIGDEAAGLGKDMIDALGNITTAKNNRLLLIANPTDPTSPMALIWKKKMKGWIRMHISVRDSPLITNEPGFDISRAEGLSGQDYIDEKEEEWGKDDPRFIARVDGQWAFDAGNNLFTDVDLARAGNTVVLPDPDSPIYFGCDIARMGADATFIYARRVGEVWTTDPQTGKPVEQTGKIGLHVRHLDHWIKAPLVGSDPANLGSAQRIHAHALAEGATVIMVDASGLGSGVIDGLAELNQGNYEVIEVFGGAASSDSRAFINARAEQYFELKRKMFAHEIDLDPKDTDLFDELRTVVYEFNDQGVRKIESKDSMKKRGVKSPDRADALWYAAMDVSAIVENPLAGVKPGEKLALDVYDMLDDELESLDMPW